MRNAKLPQTNTKGKEKKDRVRSVDSMLVDYCSLAYSALACFRIGTVWVGVFSQGKEVLVSGTRRTQG
ncbi:hypothetical protein SBA7_320042 [Candidatus Sulfotelmatobacter sp. SbA7]|nr:hypothetical protein SBA7_320042 [Candidatus Sulfotelmatobacter sp. SbA7]